MYVLCRTALFMTSFFKMWPLLELYNLVSINALVYFHQSESFVFITRICYGKGFYFKLLASTVVELGLNFSLARKS